jgi:hypothetical protein
MSPEEAAEMELCRRHGDVTDNGVAFNWGLETAAGAWFRLFREAHHTDADIAEAKRQLRRDRDVVGAIRVIK